MLHGRRYGGLIESGGVPKRPNGRALKACELRGSVGSNPTSTARCQNHNVLPGLSFDAVVSSLVERTCSFEP